METMAIRTHFDPLRMVAGQTTPIGLYVLLRNNTDQMRNYTITLKIPFVFGFDKAGLMKESRRRVEHVSPAQKKEAGFQIWGRYNIQPGLYDFTIIVKEHENRFDKVVSQKTVKTQLRVEG